MNTTQPCFKFKGNQTIRQKLYINKPCDLMLVEDQIHKFPDSVRKSMKLGKHRKNYRSCNPEKKESFLKKRYLEDQQKLKIHLNVQRASSGTDIISLTCENPYRISSIGQKQSQSIDLNCLPKYSPDKLQNTADRMLYYRKKLSPIKKLVPSYDKNKIDLNQKSKNMKITFLNIEKLELIKIFQEKSIEKDQENQINISQEVAIYNRYFSPKKQSILSQEKIVDLMESTAYSLRKQSKKSQTFHRSGVKFKPFLPPFERYFYKDFLWKVAFSNGIKFESPQEYSQKFKVFIGRGNNSLLVKSLFKRRNAWWSFTDKLEEAHVAWTQIKMYEYFRLQKKCIGEGIQEQEKKEDMIKLTNAVYENHIKILNKEDLLVWNKYYAKHRHLEEKMNQEMTKRNKMLSKGGLRELNQKTIRVHNHLTNNYIIGNKKALFYTMTKYYECSAQDVFDYLPLTFHVVNGLEDQQYLKFLKIFYEKAKNIRKQEGENGEAYKMKNIWIVKPGEFTNRGNGINVCLSLQEIKKILKKKQTHENGNLKTYIIQAYIERPFLYQRRKFDIRHYMMITSINGIIKGYWYKEGYIRTTSAEYSVKTNFSAVHLTNDAVQKYLPEYGKFEKGNKLSYEDFQKYLNKEYPARYDFYQQIYPLMKKIATDSIRASALLIDPERKQHNFQIFGLDFMIDEDFRPWLIEINNNPCLELSCPILAQIIPDMVENALKICIDPLMPPPCNFIEKRPRFNDNVLASNKFQMVYDSVSQEQQIRKLFGEEDLSMLNKDELEKEDDEIFEDDGTELED